MFDNHRSRAVGKNESTRNMLPSNQVHHTASSPVIAFLPTCVTVILGPPEITRTTSPGLNCSAMIASDCGLTNRVDIVARAVLRVNNRRLIRGALPRDRWD